MSRMRLGRVTVVAAIAALAAGGCGDDDSGGGGGGGGEDAQAIEAVAVKAVTSRDPEVRCSEAVTTAFVRAVYSDVATCRKAEKPEPDDKPATGAEVTDVQVDGDKATATVTTQGGESDGATGPLSFAKEDGAWKVDELSVAFLRSQLSRGLETGDFDEDDGPLADPEARECIGKGLQALDDTTFRNLAHAAIADREPTPQFLEVITTCAAETPAGGSGGGGSAGSGGTGESSLLRRQFEDGVRESLEEDKATKAQIDCVVKELRRTISEDEIVDQVKAGGGANTALAGKGAEAIRKCG